MQEVIVQNFLPKPGTAMHQAPPCPPDEHLDAIALARLVLPPDVVSKIDLETTIVHVVAPRLEEEPVAAEAVPAEGEAAAAAAAPAEGEKAEE